MKRRGFPRAKLCGGYLSAEAIPELKDLGLLDVVKASGAWPIHRILVSAPSGNQAESRLMTPAFSISRDRFDAILLNAGRDSGVEVFEGEDGTAHRNESPWLVMAAGRALTRPPGTKRGLRGAFFGVQARFDDLDGITDQVELDMIPGGYVGLVRQGRFVNVCALLDQPTLRHGGAILTGHAPLGRPESASGKPHEGGPPSQRLARCGAGRDGTPPTDSRKKPFLQGMPPVSWIHSPERDAMSMTTGRLLKDAFLEYRPTTPCLRMNVSGTTSSIIREDSREPSAGRSHSPWWQEIMMKSCQTFPPLMRWLTDNTRASEHVQPHPDLRSF